MVSCLKPWQVQRRMQSILAAGWTVADLANFLAIDMNSLWWEVTQPQASRSMDFFSYSIAELWKQIENEPVRPAEPIVQAEGWKVPFDWDDIDDPQELNLARLYHSDSHIVSVTPDNLPIFQDRYRELGLTISTLSHAVGCSSEQVKRALRGIPIARPTLVKMLRHLNLYSIIPPKERSL